MNAPVRLAALTLAAAAAAATFGTAAHALPPTCPPPQPLKPSLCLLPRECVYYPDEGYIVCYY